MNSTAGRDGERANTTQVDRPSMDALVMCGGKGSRLAADVEKPLVEVDGDPMVARVLGALGDSRVETVHAVTSPETPETKAYLEGRTVPVIEGAGEGYVTDLRDVLEIVEPPVVTVVADLPLLSPTLVDHAIAAHDGRNVTLCVPTRLKETLDVSADTVREYEGRRLSPTGLNVVAADADGERVEQVWDARAAVNVNYPSDLSVAEALA